MVFITGSGNDGGGKLNRTFDFAGSVGQVYEIDPPQMVVDIEHNRGRHVVVEYYNRQSELVEVATEYLDENNVRVSAVNFLDGHILII